MVYINYICLLSRFDNDLHILRPNIIMIIPAFGLTMMKFVPLF